MNFDWNEYLIHAKELSGTTQQKCTCKEALLRSSISRAYYSVFIQTRNKLENTFNKHYGPHGVHKAVRDDLDSVNRPLYTQLSTVLSGMSISRNRADYNNILKQPERVVNWQLTQASIASKILSQI